MILFLVFYMLLLWNPLFSLNYIIFLLLVCRAYGLQNCCSKKVVSITYIFFSLLQDRRIGAMSQQGQSSSSDSILKEDDEDNPTDSSPAQENEPTTSGQKKSCI
jgi:hypothetical protein